MQKAYSRINWENYPSTETPVNETNLNRIDEGLNTVDNRVVEFDLTKANQTDLLTCVDGITFNTSTGILTISFKNGTTATIDTGLAKLAVNFDYDEDPTSPHYQQLILEMKDGTYKYIDLSSMITQFEFDNTSTVVFNVDAQTGHISAVIPDGSITANKLNPNVVVTMQAIEDAAEADALKSEGFAVGEQNGVPVGPGSPYYKNNAKHYCEEAQGGGSGGHVIKDDTQTFIQRTGLKFSGKVAVTDDVVGGNTVVTVEAGGAVPHLIVISETGSTVTATKGTTVISATETSPEHFECDLEMDDPQDIYGVWVIDAVLAGDDAQVSLNVDTIKVYTVDDSHFHANITVTYPTGATVSCSKTGEQTMYATDSPYTFTVHSAGVWTITGSRNGITETQTVTISTTGQTESITLTILPDGSTITPTDDVQILLNCADIWDKTTYTTIADLIADDTSLLTVLTSDNAIDYLVRSTTFASAITADSDAMAMIGSYDYASDTLLADSTWATAIAESTYKDSVINVSVPTMTSDTTPSGKVVASSSNTGAGRYAWKAFDKINADSNQWQSATGQSSAWIYYEFERKSKIKLVEITPSASSNGSRIKDFDIMSSNDEFSTSNTLYSDSIANEYLSVTKHLYIIPNTTEYQAYKVNIKNTWETGGGISCGAHEINFLGRENGGVQTWLRSGGITDKTYTTLAEVLADTTTLSALIASHDASDYLVTAKGLIDGIVADATAMSYIGLNNYCTNTLLGDVDWCNGICNSTYFESVLNVKVPTMTSNTTPSGQVLYSSQGSPDDGYMAFDKNNSTQWSASQGNFNSTEYIGYKFTTSFKALLAKYTQRTLPGFSTNDIVVKYQGSNDNSTWIDISDSFHVCMNAPSNPLTYSTLLSVLSNYNYYRLLYVSATLNNGVYPTVAELQFYGREDV